MPTSFSPDQIEQIGRFRVVRFIAGGGQAFVFEVEDPDNFDDRVALKLLKRDAADEADLARFEREIRVQRLIKHPNLITVYEWGEDPGTGCPFYVMDLMTGGTLADVRVSLGMDPSATVVGPVVDEARVCKYVVGALSALEAIHARDMIHRDIKPQNIFLSDTGIAVLGDLGIAKRSDDPGLTRQGFAPGTVLYMSPEQMMGETIDARSDLFSMGLVLYRVLTGHTIYEDVKDLDSTNSNAVQRHLWDLQRGGQEFRFEFPPQVSASIQEVVRRACAMRADERYANAAEMANALKRAIRTIESGQIEAPSRPLPWRWIAAGALVLAIGVGAWRVYEYRLNADVEVRIEGARVLRMQAAEARMAVQRTGGSDVEALLASVDPVINEAGDDLFDAEALLDAGSRSGARSKLEQAEKGFIDSCDALSQRHLSKWAEKSAREALALAATVHPIAEQRHAEEWAELQRAKAALETPIEAAGCEGSRLLTERANDAQALGTQVASLEVLLQASLPEIAQAAIQSAVEADQAAGEAEIDFAPYRKARESGAEQLARARKTLQRAAASADPRDYLAVEAEAKEARESFALAAAASGAHAARRQASALERELGEAGVGVGEIRQVLVAAESAFEGASWADARAGYTDASLELSGMLGRSQQARTLRDQADQARHDAVSAGVKGGPLDEADEKYNTARAQLRGRQFAAAETGFQASIDVYRKAESGLRGLQDQLDAAEQAIRAARDARKRAQGSGGGGAEFDGAFAAGSDALAAAEDHARKGEYDLVEDQVRQAQAAFDEAERIAPAYRAQQTARSRIEKARAMGLGEELWARDQRGAEAAYGDGAWQLAEREYSALAETVDGFAKRASQPIASRGRANKQRKRAVSLGAGEGDLASGDRQRGRGEEELQRGNFEDASGRFDQARELYAAYVPPKRAEPARPKPAPQPPRPEPVVQKPPPSEPAPVEPVRQTAKPAPPPPAPAPAPVVATDKPVRQTIEEYRLAYEEMDLRRLKGVWKMSPGEEDDLRLMQEMCQTLSVKIDELSIDVSEDRATAEFVQTVSGSCGFISSFPPNRYTAQLRRRGGGDWQITARRKAE